MLAGDKFRAVNGKERLALFHELISCVDHYIFHPPWITSLNIGDAPFVHVHCASGSDFRIDCFVLDPPNSHAYALHAFW